MALAFRLTGLRRACLLASILCGLGPLAAQAGNPYPACSDGVDNDGDGLTDYPADPGCTGAWSVNEDPECSDGVDNDTDGAIDWPADPSCSRPDASDEGAIGPAVIPIGAGTLALVALGLGVVGARRLGRIASPALRD